LLCCSADPRVGNWCCAVHLFQERAAGDVLFNSFTKVKLELCCLAAPREGNLCCAVQLLHGRAVGFVLSAAPPEGSWCCAVKLLHGRAVGFVLSVAPLEGSWCCAVKLLHGRAAGDVLFSCSTGELHAGVMLFSCSTEGQLVLCSSAALWEDSWCFAVQLLYRRVDGVVPFIYST
jgi:hypothetical protein